MNVRLRHKYPYNHELIGQKCEIISSTDPSLEGKKGDIVDETMNTLIINEGNSEKIIPKCNVTLLLKINKVEVIIKGKRLIGRPEDRVKNR
jgi:ribonuclease P protein subunit POP4|tara:strand:+ start:643 stop:915 length:273 start_codon:yes stop_codon:yes gene_type:complete